MERRRERKKKEKKEIGGETVNVTPVTKSAIFAVGIVYLKNREGYRQANYLYNRNLQ